MYSKEIEYAEKDRYSVSVSGFIGFCCDYLSRKLKRGFSIRKLWLTSIFFNQKSKRISVLE